MIEKVISFSIKNKLTIGVLTIALIVWGLYSLTQLPIDAVPDITNNQVQVMTVTPKLATQEVEQFITFPVEIAMSNIPGVIEIRSISRFGLSVVTIVFEEDIGTYLPRQLISEKLNEVKEEIPEGLGKPFMGPITTGLGEIYQYVIIPKEGYDTVYSPMELRTIQDWIVKRQLAMTPGIVEVNSFGGYIKQYEVAIDPEKLKAMDVTIADVFEALEKNNENTGGSYIEKDHKAYLIRGEGIAKSKSEIGNIVVKINNNVPILIKNIAEVRFGSQVRFGLFTRNGEGESVGGMIMMLKGENSDKVLKNVKEKINKIQESLPEGLEIHPFIDRSELISHTTSTITENLVLGGLIVIFVLILLLGNYRAGLIVASAIPLSMMFAFGMMNVFGVWVNLMSLGAIDFGIIVDGAVIIVESIVFLVAKKSKEFNRLLSKEEMDTITFDSSSKMLNSAFFGQLIILIVYLPILALTGVEGKMFKPMAYVLIFAMIGVIILCFTYVPMISSIVLRSKPVDRVTISDKIMHFVNRLYLPSIAYALKKKTAVLISALVLLAVSAVLFVRLGGEFVPQLDEGIIAFHIILKPGTNLTEAKEMSTKIEAHLLKKFPEIKEIASRFGVSEVPTDPMPMDLADTFVLLKDQSEWTSADSKDELIEKMKQELALFPGVSYEFTQPIEMRFNELLSGVREDIAVKIYGEDINVLAGKANEAENIIRNIDGVADLKAETIQGLPQISISYDRGKIARYGLNIEGLNRVMSTAFGGEIAGVIFEGEKRFDLVVRLKEEYRTDIEHLQNIYIPLPDGNQIPLKELAQIQYVAAPMQISRENTNRRTYVGVNVSGRDVASLVSEIKEKLNANLKLPPGYYIEYGGAFENFEEASKRLSVVVPVALALIFILLYFSLKSVKQTLMIFTAIPLAGIGGVLSLYLRDMHFSISAGIGFIALFGVAVLNGLVLINRFNDLKRQGVEDLNERIIKGTRSRLRAILLTASVDILGFLPMAVSTSAGAEVQRPLATVVIGGLITATILTLIVLPVLYYLTEKGIRNQMRLKFKLAPAILLFVAAILYTQNNYAQEKITVDEAVKIAFENYPGLKSAKLKVDKEESLQKSVWDLGDTEIFYSKEETDGSTDSGIESFGIKQQIDFPLTYIARSSHQSSKVDLMNKVYEINKNDLTRNIYSSYYQLLYAKSRLNLAQKLNSVFRDFETAAKIRYETGETNKLEMLSAIGKKQEIQTIVEATFTKYQIALQEFNKWLMSDKHFIADENELDVYELDVEIDTTSIEGSPWLNYFKQQIELQSDNVSVKYSELLPKIILGYAKQRIGGVSGFYSFQAGISFPLWFFAQQGRIQEAELDEEIAQWEYLEKKISMNTEIRNKLVQHERISSLLEYYSNQALPLAEEQFDFAEKSFSEGEIDYVEYIQNIQQSIDIQFAYRELVNRHNQSVIELKYLIGNFN
jgi:cobalt-zinc-cadmium resistance protein CzcA